MPFRAISQKAAVSVVYTGAMFIAVMDLTIVNVALATIGREFHASAAGVAGTVIGYQVAVALSIPAAAWLGDRLGPRQVLLGAIAIFTVASALCGLAGSLDELVAFRVLQGVGGGLMTPVGLTMLFRAFPQQERVRASAILIVPTALAPAVGPIIGGLFVTDVSWRWVFYVNVPVGVFALVFGVLFLADQDHPAAGRFDVRRVRHLQSRARPADVRGVRGPEHRVDERRRSSPASRRARCCSPRWWSSSCGCERRCSTCGSTPTGCSARPASC